MALEVKRETFLQKPGNYFRDSQAAGCKQQGSSASEGAEEWTRLSRSHAADFPSLSNACSVAYRTVCSQFFLRNNLFCSKFRTTRWSGALGHPKKKTFLLSRKSLSVNRPGFAKKLGGLQLVYGHVPIEISYNERHTPTPATEFPFIYLFIYLFIYSFIYYSAKFSPNYQTILVSIFLNTSEDACRMPWTWQLVTITTRREEERLSWRLLHRLIPG